MSLRATAEADLKAIVNDSSNGFGWPISITDPSGLSASLTGFSSDISQVIDPDTGQAVSGRLASVAVNINDLTAAGFTSLPRNITEKTSKPWVVVFNDIMGNSHTFKVAQSNPDRALGIVVCLLENYQ